MGVFQLHESHSSVRMIRFTQGFSFGVMDRIKKKHNEELPGLDVLDIKEERLD